MGITMLKTLTAVLTAAAIAGVLTILTAPAPVDAGPLAQPQETALKACTQLAWPYLNCVGTPFGNPRIRLVSTDRLAQ
jgi:hypothetical protein